jgi:hypothetical protein
MSIHETSGRNDTPCAKIRGDDRPKKTLGVNVGNDEENVYDARTPFLTVIEQSW